MKATDVTALDTVYAIAWYDDPTPGIVVSTAKHSVLHRGKIRRGPAPNWASTAGWLVVVADRRSNAPDGALRAAARKVAAHVDGLVDGRTLDPVDVPSGIFVRHVAARQVLRTWADQVALVEQAATEEARAEVEREAHRKARQEAHAADIRAVEDILNRHSHVRSDVHVDAYTGNVTMQVSVLRSLLEAALSATEDCQYRS